RNNAAILGIHASGEARCRTAIRRPRCQYNAVAGRSAERGIVSEGLKRRQLVVVQPCIRHERPAEAVIQGESPGHLPSIAKVKLYVAPARIADGVVIVLVRPPECVLQDRVRPLIAGRGTPTPKARAS